MNGDAGRCRHWNKALIFYATLWNQLLHTNFLCPHFTAENRREYRKNVTFQELWVSCINVDEDRLLIDQNSRGPQVEEILQGSIYPAPKFIHRS